MRILENKTLELLKTLNGDLILEASKKDALINKVGFNEDNAEFLFNLCGSLSVWMANKLIEAYVEYFKNTGWDSSSAANKFTDVEIRELVIDKINQKGLSKQKTIIPGIMDWITVGLNGNLGENKKLTFPELMDKSKLWHEELGVSGGDINYVEKNPVVLDFRDDNGNGFYWVNLETNDSTEECNRMGHCGRTNRNNSIYSLREVKTLRKGYEINKSRLTASIGDSDGILYQLKGPKNSKPKEEFNKYILPLFYVLGGPGEEEDYLISGVGSEYDSENDFKITDLPNDLIMDLYKNREEFFKSPSMKYRLYIAGILDESPINWNIRVDTVHLDRFVDGDWVLHRRRDKEGRTHETTMFDTILMGNTYDLWGDVDGDWESALQYDTNVENEKIIQDYLTNLAKENGINIEDMSLDDMVKELDEDYEVRNALSSSQNDAQAGDYSNYLYNELKTKVEDYGEVISMNDEGVVFDVDVEQFLSLDDDEWTLEMLDNYGGDVKEMFEDLTWSDEWGFQKPKFSPDDRYVPDVNEEYFNDILSDRLSEFI